MNANLSITNLAQHELTINFFGIGFVPSILLVVFSSIICSWLLVKSLIPLLINKDIVDLPNDRSLHIGKIPRGGGLAIVIMLLMSIAVFGLFSGDRVFYLYLFSTVLAWSSLSWIDDRNSLSVGFRLATQSLFTAMMILMFGFVDHVSIDNGSGLNLGKLGILLTAISALWLTNLYNFMDGMDGLAASQTIVAGLTLWFWLWQFNNLPLSLICLVLAAASYGFLLHNWYPAKIFMGDIGSITIGAFFSVLVIVLVVNYDVPLVSMMLLFGVFIIDASVTIAHRIISKQRFWLPHKTHYYQRLANIGFSHELIVINILVLMIICSIISTISLLYRDIIVYCILLEILIAIGAIFIVRFLEQKHLPKS